MSAGVLRRLSTLRHGRGFGVHSPLAYELITSVLRDRPAYYGDTHLHNIYKNKRQRRLARIVLRLISRFEPAAVTTIPLYAPVVSLASKKTRMVNSDNEANMTIADESGKIFITFGHP